MNRRLVGCLAFSLCALTLSACGKESSPTAPTVTITQVTLVSPAANVLVPHASQPVTLTVTNATVTNGGSVTYVFEVATDSGFANKVATKSVAEGSGGRTSAALDTLGAGDYFWRARADSSGTPGPVSASSKFTIGPAISLSAPTAVSPSDGAKTSRRPTFKVKNATKSGAVGAITYKFDVSTTNTFTTIVVSATLAEGAAETSYTPPADLTPNTKYFWRATAIDAANGVSSTPSAVQSVTTLSDAEVLANEKGVPLWPGTQPPGTAGKAGGMSEGWEVEDRVAYNGDHYASPPIEALRLYDLIDRGLDPQAAIDWLADHGYPSTGQWYSQVAVIGIQYVYMALIGGQWELVHRAGA